MDALSRKEMQNSIGDQFIIEIMEKGKILYDEVVKTLLCADKLQYR